MFQSISLFREDTDNEFNNLTSNNISEYFTIPSRDLFIKCQYFSSIFTAYVDTTIGFVGSILNVLCLIAFSNEVFNYPKRIKCKMFKYLMIKSIFDACILFFKALIPIFKCEECFLNTAYAFNVFDLFINKYFIFVCTLCSIFFELAAQFDRLITVSKLFQFLNRISLKIVVSSIISIIAVFYSFKLLEYTIKNFEGSDSPDYSSYPNENYVTTMNSTARIEISPSYTFYYLYKSDFSSTEVFKYLEITHSIVRDFVCVIVLLAVDTLILVEFRKLMRNKKKILNRKNDEISLQTYSCSKKRYTFGLIEQAENRTTLMILLIGFTTFFGRLPIFFNYLPIGGFHLKSCYQTISETLFLANIASNFFIYYFFNRSFKGVICGYFARIKNCKRVPNSFNSTTASCSLNNPSQI